MQFSSLIYEILHISSVKMIAQTFQNKIGILYISYENLCAYFSLDITNFMVYTYEKQGAVFFSMKCRILHISLVNICLLFLAHKDGILFYFHICKLENLFSSIKYGILYSSHKKT